MGSTLQYLLLCSVAQLCTGFVCEHSPLLRRHRRAARPVLVPLVSSSSSEQNDNPDAVSSGNTPPLSMPSIEPHSHWRGLGEPFDMQLQQEQMSLRLQQIRNNVTKTMTPPTRNDKNHFNDSMVVTEPMVAAESEWYDMEIQRQRLALKFAQISQQLELDHVVLSVDDTDRAENADMDGTPETMTTKTEIVVEADFVAPLAMAKKQQQPPNLYRIGFDLQNEAKKTKMEQAAAAELEQKVKRMQQEQRARLGALQTQTSSKLPNVVNNVPMKNQTTTTTVVNRRRSSATDDTTDSLSSATNNNQDVSSSSSSLTTATTRPDRDVVDLEHAGAQLEAATKKSKSRLSALDRAMSALLEMQAEVEDLEKRVQQRALQTKNVVVSDKDDDSNSSSFEI